METETGVMVSKTPRPSSFDAEEQVNPASIDEVLLARLAMDRGCGGSGLLGVSASALARWLEKNFPRSEWINVRTLSTMFGEPIDPLPRTVAHEDLQKLEGAFRKRIEGVRALNQGERLLLSKVPWDTPYLVSSGEVGFAVAPRVILTVEADPGQAKLEIEIPTIRGKPRPSRWCLKTSWRGPSGTAAEGVRLLRCEDGDPILAPDLDPRRSMWAGDLRKGEHGGVAAFELFRDKPDHRFFRAMVTDVGAAETFGVRVFAADNGRQGLQLRGAPVLVRRAEDGLPAVAGVITERIGTNADGSIDATAVRVAWLLEDPRFRWEAGFDEAFTTRQEVEVVKILAADPRLTERLRRELNVPLTAAPEQDLLAIARRLAELDRKALLDVLLDAIRDPPISAASARDIVCQLVPIDVVAAALAKEILRREWKPGDGKPIEITAATTELDLASGISRADRHKMHVETDGDVVAPKHIVPIPRPPRGNFPAGGKRAAMAGAIHVANAIPPGRRRREPRLVEKYESTMTETLKLLHDWRPELKDRIDRIFTKQAELHRLLARAARRGEEPRDDEIPYEALPRDRESGARASQVEIDELAKTLGSTRVWVTGAPDARDTFSLALVTLFLRKDPP